MITLSAIVAVMGLLGAVPLSARRRIRNFGMNEGCQLRRS